MTRLKDKVVAITGGTGGIGRATALLFLNQGAKVVVSDLHESEIHQFLKETNHADLKGVVCDVSKEADNKRLIDFTIESFGRIDVLFANAGVEGLVLPLTEYPEDTWDLIFNVNVKGVWFGIKHAFPVMEKNGGGSIIITSSVAGLKGTPHVSAYTTSKHATIGLMRSAALEGAPKGIRVNSIHPSPVDNRMMRSLEEGFAPGQGEAAKKGFEQMIPLKRYASNEDIANLALFLASDESSFITGAIYPVDGGMTA